MANYDLSFYDVDADTIFSRTVGATSTYTGPASAAGDVTITDNGAGIDGLTLEDSKKGETATATTTLNGVTVSGTGVDAERSWTVRDTVTGEEFQVIRFRIDSGANAGNYTLSEQPLVVGRSYEIVNYDKDPDAGAGDPVLTYSEYVPESDGVVDGTTGDDTIDATYTDDPHQDMVDGNDAPGVAAPTASEFNWNDYTDEQDLRGGVSQDTGGITVNVTYSDVQTNEEFSAELSGGTDAIYVAPGEPFNTNSAGYIFANGSADNTTVTMDFSANTGSGFENEVENVSFRISDIDGLNDGSNNFLDIVTVRAFDADGNEVPVVITGGSNHTVTGNTVTASASNGSAGDESGSALFEIAGPASQIVITYDNGGTTQQAVYLSDVHFDSVPLGADDDVINAGDGNDTVYAGYGDDTVNGDAGNDILDGQSGNDTLSGGTGNDTLYMGQSDVGSGDDGDDTFLIDGAQLNGGSMTIVGGEGAETAGDTLDFNGQLVLGSIVYTDPTTAIGRESGTATLLDGTTVTFSEIENIICFVSGTDIETPYGPRKIEQLRAGDLVLTRDCGPQPIRWAGKRTIKTTPTTAPIEFMPGTVGNTSRLLVSPQHRMLHTGYQAELYFGASEVLVAASHLVNGQDIFQCETGIVTYHHFVFDDHQIVSANGAASESYHPGAYSLPGLHDKSREELCEVFPELRVNPIAYGKSARLSVRGQLAPLLAA
ncbi:Hint domain-containing protein [Litoreibacter halocynthiae]|uniref:Hint domain-containing protein n=1 Tax=Litoreibacter halocynthiae TaxID=1242689 RepID=UPI0024916BD2|nr:Hint domain-containing protein [Litoreibacter halocynthiae]